MELRRIVFCHGRISRAHFALAMAALAAIGMLLFAFSPFIALGLAGLVSVQAVFVLAVLLFTSFSIRRFHDFGLNFAVPAAVGALMVVASLIGYSNHVWAFWLVYALGLMLWPGQLLSNRFGANPELEKIDNYLGDLVNVSPEDKPRTSLEVAIEVNLPNPDLVEQQTKPLPFLQSLQRSLDTFIGTYNGRITGFSYLTRNIFYALLLLLIYLPIVFIIVGFDVFAENRLYEWMATNWLTVIILAVPIAVVYYRLFTLLMQRLHDIGISGWWAVPIFVGSMVSDTNPWFMAISVIAGLANLAVLICPGERGINRFGKDPRVFIYLNRRAIIRAKIALKHGEEEAAKLDGEPEEKPKKSAPKKATPKKAAAKKTASKKASAKKTPTKKATTKAKAESVKEEAKKAPAKKTATKKAPAKKAPAKKTTAKKPAAKKAAATKKASTAKKTTSAKKAAPKKASAKKTAATKKTTSKKKES